MITVLNGIIQVRMGSFVDLVMLLDCDFVIEVYFVR
jgi:hypothetical protein